MKSILLVIYLFLGIFVNQPSQADKIYKHNGEVVVGKVLRVEEFTITYVYDGEDAEYTISKYAVERIIHGKSGREENVTEKILLRGEQDWEKVLILEDKSYTAGLKKVEEIKGKTAFINYHTGNTGDKKAEKKLKMAAAKLGCPFILLTSDVSTVGDSSNMLGGTQKIKKGIAYKY